MSKGHKRQRESATQPPGQPFGAIPLHALADRRLSELHLRVLGIIAYHDRMSLITGSGQGCWASVKRMAEEIGGYNYTNAATAIRELTNWGYIQVEQRPSDKRMKIHRVMYDSANSLPLGQTKSRESSVPCDEDSMPQGHSNCPDSMPHGKLSPEIVCPADTLSGSSETEIDAQYIPLNGIINSVKRTKEPGDAGPSDEAPPADGISSEGAMPDAELRTLALRHVVRGSAERLSGWSGVPLDALTPFIEGAPLLEPYRDRLSEYLTSW